MKRDTARTIFRTVVFAGAMLGAPACAKKTLPPATPPANTSNTTEPAMVQDEKAKTNEVVTPTPDPCADPCGGGERPRGVDDDGGGGAGRGFILS